MRKYLDKNDYYGEIVFWLSARKEKSIGVVVEAKADELFFRKFFSDDTVFFSVDGFPNVKSVLSETEKNKIPGILGIMDADFRRITKEKVESENIFLTDGHDVEMMTINSPAWDNIINYYKDEDKLREFERNKKISLKEYIFDLSRQVACVRFLKLEAGLDLKFKTLSQKGDGYNFIDYHKFIDKDRLTLDKDKMLEVIENKSQKQGFFKNNPKLKQRIEAICKENYDLKEFCNGHDFMNILSLAFRKVISNQTISGKNIEERFVIAYRFDDFKLTNLYISLLNWEKDNYDFVLYQEGTSIL